MNCFRCATPLPENSRFCLSCGADVSGETAERTQPVEIDSELLAKLQEDLGGDFVIERELGRGGMAAVFLARDMHLDRSVAIKVLPPELTYGRGMVERFKREAKMAATLDHPHVIPIHRVSTSGKVFWYAMKYVEGESLSDILQREAPLSVNRSADIIAQVAEALDYAHERGVIHRDVKPANVMIDAKGWVTVTDFGIAKALGQQSMTGSGSMIGTPYYMSPEQCSGKKISGASDQYSLGVMAYQMLSGHLPFTGESVVDIIKKHCFDPPPPLAILCPGTPPQLAAVVERALAKAPESRFPSVADFATAFIEAAGGSHAIGIRVQARTPADRPAPRRSVTAAVSPVPGTLPPAPAPPPRGRRLWVAVTTVAGVILVSVAALLVWRESRTLSTQSAAPNPAVPRGIAAPAPSIRADSPVTATETTATGRQPPVASPGHTARARLILTSLPAGASITRNGRAVTGSSWLLQPGLRYSFSVTAPGFEPWSETFTLRPGQTERRPVLLRPTSTAAAPARPAVPSTATGDLYVWSSPPIPFTIAGRRYEANPTTVRGLPAGLVTIRFDATDSTLTFERTVEVVAGGLTRTGRIPLPRRQ